MKEINKCICVLNKALPLHTNSSFSICSLDLSLPRALSSLDVYFSLFYCISSFNEEKVCALIFVFQMASRSKEKKLQFIEINIAVLSGAKNILDRRPCVQGLNLSQLCLGKISMQNHWHTFMCEEAIRQMTAVFSGRLEFSDQTHNMNKF